MKRVLILALCVLPLISQADIGYVPENIEALQGVRVTGNTVQELGTRLSGTGTKLELYVTGLSLGTKILHTSLVACENIDDSPKYSPSCEKTLLGEYVGISTTSPAFQKQEYEFSYEFDSEKHYFLLFDYFGGGIGPILGATAENTYPHGACHSSARDSDCVVLGSIDTVSDFAFSIEGIEVLPVVLPENPPTDTPIIFLPGIFGSRLYHGEEKVWDGAVGEKMRQLFMSTRGESINEIKVGNILETFEAGYIKHLDIYKSLQEHFSCNGSFSSSFVRNIPGNSTNCGAPLVNYPYDWRYDVFDILDKGTNYTSGENIKLIDLVEHLSNNPTGKVHILAHSNGGLLAKALMVRLEEQGKENLIDKIILVGSPQLGTPKSVGAMLHGYDQGQIGGLVKKQTVSRLLSLNSPGAYALLPSEEYIENNSPVVYFDNSPATKNYFSNFGETINSYTEFADFLLDTKNLREQANERALNEPFELNETLLKKAGRTHAKIDNWSPDQQDNFIQIVGIGNDTEEGFTYSSKRKLERKNNSLIFHRPWKLVYNPLILNRGDGDVASAAGKSKFGSTYYFDFEDLLDLETRSRDHTSFFAEEEVLVSVSQILNNLDISSPYITKDSELKLLERLVAISVHSPVTIAATDSQNRISSVTYDEDSELFRKDLNIPGSFARIVGEDKYLFLPEGKYDIEVQGLDTGSFDLVLSEVNENGKLTTLEKLEQIPVKESSSASTSISTEGISTLTLDLNNDGQTNYSFSNNSSQEEEIANQLKDSLLELTLRPQLKSAIEQYFDLWSSTEDLDKKANYMAQIKRILTFLEERYITKDTANEWTALVEHLQ